MYEVSALKPGRSSFSRERRTVFKASYSVIIQFLGLYGVGSRRAAGRQRQRRQRPRRRRRRISL